MERRKRYSKKFVAWIERKCQESGDLRPVDEDFYETFLAYTEEDMVTIVELILHATGDYINKKLFSGEWDSEDDLFEFVMLFLEMLAEGKLAFHEETGKILFLKPVGDLPSEDMWDKIQERIASSRPAIRKAIVKNVQGRR